MDERLSPQTLRSRAQGVMIGSPIAFCWAYFGALGFAPAIRYPLLAVALVATIILLFASIAMRRRAVSARAATPSEETAGRRAWRWFWLNLVGEIVLLNIAINLLSAPDLRVYWIPAISAVVGLHFLPMAYFFRARSYHWVGAAMMAVAAVAALLVARDRTSAETLIHGEALANAAILWAALARGAATVRIGRETNSSSPRT